MALQTQFQVWILVGLTVSVALVGRVEGQLWALANGRPTVEPGTSLECRSLDGLSRSQRSLCVRYNDHMAFVAEGATVGLEECKFQLRMRRWNCTTAPNSSATKVVSVGSKEAAFSFAITAAGVVHSIARACKSGDLKACGCSKRERPAGLALDWNWGGCGDDTDYAYGFAHEFIDARERVGATSHERKARSRKIMNIHNNEAGRMSVVRATRPTCKCHGASGSCSLKTCWNQVPDFREVGDKLRQRYDDAIEMSVTHRGQMRTRLATAKDPTATDLVFVDSSPDYCNKNRKMGVLGTSGRECNKDSTGMDGCGIMCCARGFVTREVEIVKSCHCKFQWCCFVKCQKCRERVLKHICN